MRRFETSAIDAVLERAVAQGDPPAAQCCVRLDGDVVYEGAFGCAPDSVFDIASVTKVAATTTALARFVAEGRCSLDDPIGRYLPSAAFGSVSLRALLAHRSGLVAWRPLFTQTPPPAVLEGPGDFSASRASVVQQVLAAAPTETGRVYSDLGFIALGLALEAIAAQRLDVLCAPLFEGDLGFVDLAAPAPSWLTERHVLPTGRTRPREPAPGQEALFDVPAQSPREDPGCVDDDHAYAMGGVAGHAGLFATARALAAHLDSVWIGDRLALGPVRDAFLTVDPFAGAPPRALGFDTATGLRSSAGALAGPHVRGHLGFTGCSAWLDPTRRLVVTLLTNRTLEGRHRVTSIRALRPAVHDAVFHAL